ncbi:response regulator transcription factor [Thermomonas sp. HDW16]|uniref:response regulator n=1 Tax=Thermomonas sp. HDW16 TaxID=2714945 RepID=UPI001408F215|nr:response regulator transcription factor [Thermomonas sp. HDW16]QIL21111.1 response regulator transcription factor [Thermomonas sp. HDW16]
MRTGLVLEDQPPLARWLQETLEACFPGIRVTHAATLAAGLRHVENEAPDIALVDLGLPDGSGIDLIHAIHRRHPDCQIVVTTIFADDHHLFPALRAGADGYLLKDQPHEKTAQALRGIAAGEPPLSASIARRLLRVFDTEAASPEASDITLTPRERETLALIAKGYKIAEVAAQLGVSYHTAHEFIKSIYRKLKVNSRAEAALEATRLGLVNPHA